MVRLIWPLGALVLLLLSDGCSRTPGASLQGIESLYEDVRSSKDDIEVARARGTDRTPDGIALTDVVARYAAGRARLATALRAARPIGYRPRTGRHSTRSASLPRGISATRAARRAPRMRGARWTARRSGALSAGATGLRDLSERIYACFGRAAHHLPLEGRTLDRLTVLSLLPVTENEARRQRLFLALEPVWRSIDRRRRAGHEPVPALGASQRRRSRRPRDLGRGGGSGSGDRAAARGAVAHVRPRRLAGHRARRDDRAVGLRLCAGTAHRVLAPAIPLESLRPINDRFYRDLGADVGALGIRYDLEPREGKDPVAFTTVRARARLANGAWQPGEP